MDGYNTNNNTDVILICTDNVFIEPEMGQNAKNDVMLTHEDNSRNKTNILEKYFVSS